MIYNALLTVDFSDEKEINRNLFLNWFQIEIFHRILFGMY